MKLLRLLVLLVAGLSLSAPLYAGCKIDDHVDEFSKAHVIRQMHNEVSSSAGTFAFNLLLVEGHPLEMQLVTWSRNWLFVVRGQNSLKFLADDEVIEFPVDFVDGQVVKGYRSVGTREAFTVSITIEQIQKLASAKVLKCRIYGKRGYAEAEADDMQKVQRCWIEFLDKIAVN